MIGGYLARIRAIRPNNAFRFIIFAIYEYQISGATNAAMGLKQPMARTMDHVAVAKRALSLTPILMTVCFFKS